jgi:hypothetical protein
MEALIIEGTFMTPSVVLDAANGVYSIGGNSRPENPLAFFKPIFEWFNTYFERKKDRLVLSIKLDYFNTSTSKVLLDLFEHFEKECAEGADVHIIWFHQHDDEDMKDAGEELFELVPVSGELRGY